MFNILPDIYKKNIKNNYRLRRLFVIVLFVFVLQIIFLFFLFPSWVNSRTAQADLQSQIESDKIESSGQDNETVSAVIESTNAKLRVINSNVKYVIVNPIIQSLITSRIPGIYIREFAYTSVNNSTSNISLSGVSQSREALIQYVKILSATGQFKTVDSPISNFAKDKDIDFVIHITTMP